MENLDCLDKLTYLDLSFNRISHIKNLDKLVNLKNLFFVENRISKIEKLDSQVQLKMLELGSNHIRALENIDHLVNLTRLFVGRNKIKELQNLDKLVNLELLSIQVSDRPYSYLTPSYWLLNQPPFFVVCGGFAVVAARQVYMLFKQIRILVNVSTKAVKNSLLVDIYVCLEVLSANYHTSILLTCFYILKGNNKLVYVSLASLTQ